jgi:hypothetical protein
MLQRVTATPARQKSEVMGRGAGRSHTENCPAGIGTSSRLQIRAEAGQSKNKCLAVSTAGQAAHTADGAQLFAKRLARVLKQSMSAR